MTEYTVMMSSNDSIFRVTGPLWGESTGHRWIPLTKAIDAELWCFLWSTPEQTVWVNNRDASDLRCHNAHYDIMVMIYYNHNNNKYMITPNFDITRGIPYLTPVGDPWAFILYILEKGNQVYNWTPIVKCLHVSDVCITKMKKLVYEGTCIVIYILTAIDA